ncbi:branched-chain amino acid transaminase [Streptomyces sp. NPDC051940]|uniref:branched-chain amino acid transaminase n=1 Tax=Streptomyces sp. NPDC051940 TaxID=3155675 RepID=UPI003440A1D5
MIETAPQPTCAGPTGPPLDDGAPAAPQTTVWLNGRVIPTDQAVVPVMSHALHYGSAVFEGIRAYRGRHGTAVFRLTDHLHRLARSAAAYGIAVPYTTGELRSAVHEVVAASGLADAYIRPLVFRGTGSMGLDPSGTTVGVAIMAWRLDDYYRHQAGNSVAATVSTWRRIPPNALVPRAKAAGHYLNSMLAKSEAQRHGFDEAIMLDERGLVCEASAMNVLCVLDGALHTPDTTPYVLDGITRDTVLRLARDLDLDVVAGDLTVSQLHQASELLLTGTGARIAPVGQLDATRFRAPGPVTTALGRHFDLAVRGELPHLAHWLDAVAGTQGAG